MTKQERYASLENAWRKNEELRDEQYKTFMEEFGIESISLESQSAAKRIEIPMDELADECKNCIFHQATKYRNYNEGNKLQFSVPCNGIPKQFIKKEVLEQIAESRNIAIDSAKYEELKSLIIATRDPVTWAKLYCRSSNGRPWIARKQQEIMIRCSSKRVIYRCGRRTGKTDAFAIVALHAIYNPTMLARDPITGELVLDENGNVIVEKTRVLIITPRQTHADNIIRAIDGFIESNPILQNEVSSRVESPYYQLELKNGASIVCITGGTGTANAGLNIRSFSAHILLLDEVDYLDEEGLNAAKAIMVTNISTIFKGASTPLGIEDFFYEWCEKTPLYKAFHFPSFVLEHWSAIREEVYADAGTEDYFIREYVAGFTPSALGVFRSDLIKLAMKNYRYHDIKPQPGIAYSIGVDWNSHAGTEIFITAYDPFQNQRYAVDSINIPKSQFTQLVAVNTLIDLVTKWNPIALCMDTGYGDTQIQALRRYSLDNGAASPIIFNLRNIIIEYNFSSNVIIYDPIKKTEIKKRSKPFLVSEAVRCLEDQNTFLSMHDSVLEQQMIYYQVKSVSVYGVPIYAPKLADVGDHKLDAFMLSLMGLQMKLGTHCNIRSVGSYHNQISIPHEKKEIDRSTLSNLSPSYKSNSISSTEKILIIPPEGNNKYIPHRDYKTKKQSRQS